MMDISLKLLWITTAALCIFAAGLQLGSQHGRELEARDRQYEQLNQRIDQLQEDADDQQDVDTMATDITIYAYAPVRRCTDRTPHITASQQHVRPGIIALSRDLERDLGLRFGDQVHIYGLGTFEFQDRMNARHVRSADIYMPTVRQCRAFGVEIGRMVVASRISTDMIAER